MHQTSSSAIRQADLFDPPANSEMDAGPYPVSYEPIPVGRSTFRAGLSESVHSWFRLTPSFGPDLVRTMIHEMGLKPEAHIHDPFSGAGTTAIEGALEGYKSSCLEINPFLHFVGKTCLQWDINADQGRVELYKIRDFYLANKEKYTLENIENLGVIIPPIHNVHRWWRSDILRDLLVLKAAIRRDVSAEFLRFFELTLAAVLVPDLTNVTLGRLQLHFIDKSNHEMNVWQTYEKHALKMLSDLSLLNKEKPEKSGTIILGDSTDEESFKEFDTIDAVITSPPYPNRYSYIWNTRPHLYMLDMIKIAKEASSIDQKTIGGTWGTATSELGKGIYQPINEVVEHALDGVHLKIAESDQLMSNYVVHYFNRMAKHLNAIDSKLSQGSKLAYVVGNSWIKDEYIATDVILARMMEGLFAGSRIDCLHRFRRRHSGKKLYETIVYATR